MVQWLRLHASVYVWLNPFSVYLKLSQHCLLISYIPTQNKKLKKKKKETHIFSPSRTTGSEILKSTSLVPLTTYKPINLWTQPWRKQAQEVRGNPLIHAVDSPASSPPNPASSIILSPLASPSLHWLLPCKEGTQVFLIFIRKLPCPTALIPIFSLSALFGSLLYLSFIPQPTVIYLLGIRFRYNCSC